MAVDATIEDQLASLELVSDPYPLYDELRERHPVYWSQGWNAFLVTRYDDVVDVLRDSRRFVNAGRYTLFMEQLPPERRVEFGQFYEYWTKPGFNLSDPPDHALVRTLAKRFFTRRAMERIRPRVQALVDALIDDVIGTGILSLHQHPDQSPASTCRIPRITRWCGRSRSGSSRGAPWRGSGLGSRRWSTR